MMGREGCGYWMPWRSLSSGGALRGPVVGAGRPWFEERSALIGQPRQKPGQIIRDVIDISRVAAFQLPVLTDDGLGAVGYDEHRGHTELMRDHEVAGKVLEHRRLRGSDVVK